MYKFLQGLSVIIFILILILISPQYSFADSYNGFDISNSSIPKEEIISGGPPKDGIPAILQPGFVSIKKSEWLKDEDLVVGVTKNEMSKAYPLRILVWHEAVNDAIGDDPILVTYCPLCGSTLVFKRNVDGENLTFGISGLLYQSNVLFYDHQSESLWSQLGMKAVSGKMKGSELELYPSILSTWKEWRKEHPDTIVLSRNIGIQRDYNYNPYSRYEKSENLMFPVKKRSNILDPKEKVLVVIFKKDAKVYPFSVLENIDGSLKDEIRGKSLKIVSRNGNLFEAIDTEGNKLKTFVTYWFAWYTFRPDTLLYNK